MIDLLRNQEPFFEGNYLPALDASETLFLSNTYGSCALTLFFLSNGKANSDTVHAGTYGGTKYGHNSTMRDRIDDSREKPLSDVSAHISISYFSEHVV